jgi:hypothetical protein
VKWLAKSYLDHHPRASRKHLQMNLDMKALAPGPTICTQCQNPVCEESGCLCGFHLRLAAEASKRSRMKSGQGEKVESGVIMVFVRAR